MNRRRLITSVILSALVTTVVVFVPALAAAQAKDTDPFVGNFKGVAKMSDGEMPVTLELKNVNGIFAGHAMAADTDYKVESGKVTNGALTLTFGTGADAATLTLKPNSDKLIGDWVHGTKKGTVELSRFDPNAKDEISGEWDAVADAQGQPFPFTLSLKLDGDRITGSSNSQLGVGNVTTGTWKEGKLAIVLDGNITLVATMIEGKLSGDYDFAGQSSGRWVAVKKK
jgi:hypothetical protein